MTPLRWLVLATHVPCGGALGGMVRYTSELLAALSRRDDVDVAAVTTPSSADVMSAIVGRDRVRTVPDRPLPLMALRESRADLPAPWPDVDVVHGVKHLLPRHGPALRVLTVHDLLPLDRPRDFGLVKRTLLPRPYRASLRQADVLLCVSNATQRRLAAHDATAIDRCAVVPLASAGDLLAAAAQEIPELAGRQFAVVVGDASPRKNLGTLLAAWPAVTAQVPGATLAVVGPPNWGRSTSLDAWQSLERAGSLVSLRQVADTRLRWAYEHATLVLCPSLAEGFGLPVVEALDLQAPVVTSQDPALVEAAAGRAWRVIPATDQAAWAAAAVEAFRTPPSRPAEVRPARSWDDVAAESVTAVRRALDGRSDQASSRGSGRPRR